jgi:hypothetical protein
VSSHVLSLASPIFQVEGEKHIQLSGLRAGEEDTVYIILNLLHMRTTTLPIRLAADGLSKVAAVAARYQCAPAISRATLPWFDRVYATAKSGALFVATWQMVEAAYLLDEPVFSLRWTERWVLEEPLVVTGASSLSAGFRSSHQIIQKLASMWISPRDYQLDAILTDSADLQHRRHAQVTNVRADVDLLVEPCSQVFCAAAKHFIDYAPGMTPDEDDEAKTAGSICHVSTGAATTFLGAMRDEHIWPPTV